MNLSNAKYLDVHAGVRYWEDASVNDIDEDNDVPTIFGASGDEWRVRLNIPEGRIEEWPEGMTAEVHYKVCDAGLYWLVDDAGNRLAKHKSCYVPDDFLCHGGDGYGDYIILKIGADGVIADYEMPEINPDEWEAVA